MTERIEVGQLVISVAGRDRGKFYLIYDVLDDAFVRVIDGEKRKLTNPKKKNIRHLRILPEKAEVIAEKIRKGETVREEEVSNAVRTLGLSHKEL